MAGMTASGKAREGGGRDVPQPPCPLASRLPLISLTEVESGQ